MDLTHSDYGLIFWVHLILEFLAYFSPFLFSWWIILIIIILLIAQQLVFKGCILTHAQFGFDENMTFLYPYLRKLGWKVNKKRMKIYKTWIENWIILVVALVWQLVFEFRPLLI